MEAEMLARGGPGADWVSLFIGEGNERRLCELLNLDERIGGDAAVLAAANDLGLAVTDIVRLPSIARAHARGGDDRAPDLARQWNFAQADDSGRVPAVILPVGIDMSLASYEPGQATLSLEKMGDSLFIESICDLVALPLDGGLPLSITGLSLAVGRFQVRERGEVEIYGGGMAWLLAHMARAREAELSTPAHLVPGLLEQPEHYCTLVLEPQAIEWRPSMAWCPLRSNVRSVIVRDSAGLASFIHEAMRRKRKEPPLPKVYSPKAVPA